MRFLRHNYLVIILMLIFAGADMSLLPAKSVAQIKADAIAIPVSSKKLASFLESGNLWSGAFSPDKKIFASSSKFSQITEIILWDTASSSKIKTLLYHTGYLWSEPAFSPDGMVLAAGASDGIIMLWNASTGMEIKKLQRQYSTEYNSLAFSPDGKLLLAGEYKRIDVWDIQSATIIKSLSWGDFKINHLSFCPDGKVFAAGEGKRISLWSTANWNLIKEITMPFTIGGMSFSNGGKLLAVGGQVNDYTKGGDAVVLIDTATGEKLKSLNTKYGWIQGFAFNQDDTLLLAGDRNDTVTLFDIKTGAALYSVEARNMYSPLYNQDFGGFHNVTFIGKDKAFAAAGYNKDFVALTMNTAAMRIAASAKKDEFETVQEYEKRISELEIPYFLQAHTWPLQCGQRMF